MMLRLRMHRSGLAPSSAGYSKPLVVTIVAAAVAALAVVGIVMLTGGGTSAPSPAATPHPALSADTSAPTPSCDTVRQELARSLSAGWVPVVADYQSVAPVVVFDGVTKSSAYSVQNVVPLDQRIQAAAQAYLWLDPPTTPDDPVPNGRFVLLVRAAGRSVTPTVWPIYQYDNLYLWHTATNGDIACRGNTVTRSEIRDLAAQTTKGAAITTATGTRA